MARVDQRRAVYTFDRRTPEANFYPVAFEIRRIDQAHYEAVRKVPRKASCCLRQPGRRAAGPPEFVCWLKVRG